jgi:hypothetical protein
VLTLDETTAVSFGLAYLMLAELTWLVLPVRSEVSKDAAPAPFIRSSLPLPGASRTAGVAVESG